MNYAPVWKRALAFYIDLLAVSLPMFFLIIWLWSGIGPPGQRQPDPGGYVSLPEVLFLLCVLFAFLYFVIPEALWGVTPGKLALGIKVVRLDGGRCGLGPALVRNLFRAVDIQLCFLVGLLFIVFSPRGQRLGDRLAGTVVTASAAKSHFQGNKE